MAKRDQYLGIAREAAPASAERDPRGAEQAQAALDRHAIPRARVVLFGSYAPSLIHFRGALIEEMVARGHEVFALAPAIDENTAKALRDLGAEPVSVHLGRTSLKPLEALTTARELRRLLRRIRPDVVISYAIKPIVLGGPAAKAAGASRTVALVTGLGYAFTGGREFKRLLSRAAATVLYRRAFSQSDIIVFQNKDDQADFRRLRILPASAKSAVINGSGVDLLRFAPSPLPPGVSFLMVGRLVGDKGIREFGAAARRVKELHPEIRIGLVGWIDPGPHAITQADLDGFIAAGVHYHGFLQDVRPAISAHSVYVLPSYREGTPRSVLEAMSMGRAIITTDTPGCRQTVVHGENGLLVPPRDSDALLQAMLHFVRHPELIPAMAVASRRIAEEKYDVHKVNDALLRHARL
jgi:glycosyltransferase involved in cell wall biosynthesis